MSVEKSSEKMSGKISAHVDATGDTVDSAKRSRLTIVDIESLPAIALGAAILGTGGGGDPWIGRMMASAALRKHGPVQIEPLTRLQDDAMVVSVAAIGTPSVLIESPPGPDEFETALRALERQLGRRADAILPAEMGGLNSLIPVLIAARRGLPVVDADGMGRAFPELQMVTFNVYGNRASPLVLSAPGGDCISIDTSDNRQAELLARQVVVAMGGALAMACYPMRGAAVKACAVPDTLSLAHAIGASVLDGRRQGDPLGSLLETLGRSRHYMHRRVLVRGKIGGVQRRVEGGWTIGECRIDGSDADRGRRIDIEFRNELLRATEAGRTRAIVPDLLVVLDADTCEPLTVDALRYGRRVIVLAIGAPEVMRRPEALQVFGPRCFGFDEDFVGLESMDV